jgi:hypothetical protein
MVGLPTEGAALIKHLQTKLTEAGRAADNAFQDNIYLRIEKGEPVLRRPEKAVIPVGLRKFEDLVANHLEPTHLLDEDSDTNGR